MDYLAKETKAAISGVIVSSKYTLTMKQLNNDFQEQMGYTIPYNKLGYDSLETYLHSLHDTVQVLGEGEHARVIAISKMSAHVSELVANQRPPKINKNRFARQNDRSPPSSQYYSQYNNPRFFHTSSPYSRLRQFNDYEYQNFSGSYREYQQIEPCFTPIYKSGTYEKSKNFERTNNSNSESSYHTAYSNIASKNYFDESSTSYKQSGHNATTNFNVQTSSYKKFPEISNELNEASINTVPTLDVIYANQGSVIKSFSNFETSSRISSGDRQSLCALSDDEVFYSDDEEINMRVPQCVQNNLRTLVKKYPDGIWCAKVPDLYKKEFGKDLEYTEYGYVSLAQMCLDLGNTFHCIQPDRCDYKLFDKSLHLLNDNLKSLKVSEYLKIKASVQETTKPALPSGIEELLLHMHQDNIPLEAVKLGTYIERQWIEPTEDVESYIDVNVAEVYDPSKFWFNLKVHAAQLNKLMDNMQIFYEANVAAYTVPKLGLKVGLYISVIFLKEYHRAIIVDTEILFSKNLLRVFFIDYGSVSLMSADGICYLHNQFATFPAQAIRARLAGIYPPHQHQQWSRTAASMFLHLVKNKDLVAQIMRIDKERELLEVLLADTSDEEDFFINDALAFEQDHARFMSDEQLPSICSKFVPIVNYIHLFPTFDELETGKVPNATEMIHFENAGIGIERIYPHYFKTPEKSLKSERGKTHSWKFDYDLAEKNNAESYDLVEGHGCLLTSNTEKIEASIKPVVTEKRQDWKELLNDEDTLLPFGDKQNKAVSSEGSSKVQAQVEPDAMKQSKTSHSISINQLKNNLELMELTSKINPMESNKQVIESGMPLSPKIKDDKKPETTLRVSDEEDEMTIETKKIEAIDDKMPCKINKSQVSKKQVLNPEKPPFIPLSQLNAAYSSSNVSNAETKRNILPPPGFNDIESVPLQRSQSINYENSTQVNGVQQVLNINQIHQLQFNLQNTQPKIPLDLPLIYHYFPNVPPNLSPLLLQTTYQMQNQMPNRMFSTNPPDFCSPCFSNYSHPPCYVFQPQPITSPPRGNNNSPNFPQIRRESDSHPKVNDNIDPRQIIAMVKELKSNVLQSASKNDGDPKPVGSKSEDVACALNLKNSDIEPVISNPAGKESDQVVSKQGPDKKIVEEFSEKSEENGTHTESEEKKEVQLSSFDKECLKKDIILQILETAKNVKNLEIQSSAITNETEQCTAESKMEVEKEEDNKDVQTQGGDGEANLENSVTSEECLFDNEKLENTQIQEISTQKTIEEKRDNLKCVVRLALDSITVHVITHKNNIYFSVEELACIFLGKPISVIQIRKMFIGKEHSVSFFDISLKKYPQLKQELLKFDLIKNTAFTINLIAVSDVTQFAKILAKDDAQLSNFEMFLSNVKKLLLIVNFPSEL